MLKWTVSKRADDPIDLMLEPSRTVKRRSLGNLHRPLRTRDLRVSRRKSLGAAEINHKRFLNQNKENNVIATPHPFLGRSVTSTPFSKSEFALRDVSLNVTPNSTPTTTTAVSSLKRNLPLSPVRQTVDRPKPPQYASTLPTFDIEYSPCGIKTAPLLAINGLTVKDSYFDNPCYFRDEVPAAKRLKFSPEVTPLSKRLSELRFSKISFKRPAKNLNNNVDEDDSVLSSKALNDTALEKMIDAILESSRKTSIKRKHTEQSPTYKPADDPANDINNFVLSPNKIMQADRTIIIENKNCFNEREVRTPDSLKISTEDDRIANQNSCHLRRQRAVRRKHVKNEKIVSSAKQNDTTSPQTPIDLFKSHSFLRKSIDHLACMNTPKDLGIQLDSNAKQSKAITSIGSKTSYESTPGIESQDLQASSTPTGAQCTIRRCLTFSDSPDSMEDSLDKRKSVASSTTSRCSKSSNQLVVSGSLDLAIFADSEKIQVHVIRCKDLSKPNGGSINAYVKVALIPTDSTMDSNSGFQRTAVQRNSAKPFFDHRFMFERTKGDHLKKLQLAVWHRDREFKRSEFLGCICFSMKHLMMKDFTGSFKLQPQTYLTTPISPGQTFDNYPQCSEDVVMNIDEEPTAARTAADQDCTFGSIPFSKKAIYQLDADENLFLRFLDLDTSERAVENCNSKSDGRTPYTITKQLTRTIDKGYGFSIVWTHPPRIEKIEPGLSADLCGILPGDFVIFVDRHNVVTMPEVDILNLIRSQGNSLVLEIYRRPAQPSNVPKVFKLPPSFRTSQYNSSTKLIQNSFRPTSCLNDEMKQNKPPQIAFSKDVGSGVIV